MNKIDPFFFYAVFSFLIAKHLIGNVPPKHLYFSRFFKQRHLEKKNTNIFSAENVYLRKYLFFNAAQRTNIYTYVLT